MKREAPAAVRNREPIAAVLAQELPETGLVLEVASGTGEHALYFAKAFPRLIWQPSDPDPDARASISAWSSAAKLPNLRLPVLIDAASSKWPVNKADAIICINMIHISPWPSSQGLFAAAQRLLPLGAPLILYGPYLEDAVTAAPSNLAFDASLKSRNPDWGIRRIEDLDRLAISHGFSRSRRVEMPANNLMLTYRRQ